MSWADQFRPRLQHTAGPLPWEAKPPHAVPGSLNRVLSKAAWVAGMAALYFIAGWVGLTWSTGKSVASPVWPCSGLALAALLLKGYRLWPGIFLGALLVNLSKLAGTGHSLPGVLAVCLGIAFGNTLEALAGAWFAERFCRGRFAYQQTRTLLPFIALSAMLATTLSATLGTGLIRWAGYAGELTRATHWFTWWVGDVVSVLVVTPLILVWASPPRSRFEPARYTEGLGLLLILIVICLLAFGELFPGGTQELPLTFLLIPVLLWTALRFGPRGTATVSFIIAVLATAATIDGHGPFLAKTPGGSLLGLQNFIAVISVMPLVLAANATQRREMDAGLRLSEQRYRELFEYNPQPTWVFDYETLRFLAVNQAAVDHYGYSRKEFLDMSIMDIRPPEDIPDAREAATRAQAGLHTRKEWRHRKRDGSVISVEVALHNLIFDGRPAAIVLSTDITERKRADRKAALFSELGRGLSAACSPREAARVLAQTTDALFGWDACCLDLCSPGTGQATPVFCVDTVDGRRHEISPPARRLGPLEREALAHGGKLISRTPGPDTAPPGEFPFGAGSTQPACLMFVPIRTEAEPLGLLSIQSYSPNAYDAADLPEMQALADHCGGALERIRAETERLQAETALRERDEHLRLAMAASRMGAWTLELNGKPRLTASPELDSIFGVESARFEGRPAAFFKVVHPHDRPAVRRAMRKALTHDGDYEIEFRIQPPGRPAGWLLARGHAHLDATGKAFRVSGVAIDISAHKKAEQEVFRLNAELERRVRERTAQLEAMNKELEAFSYSVSHDLRAPLRSIRGFSEVLLERYSERLDARGQEFLRRACESSQHMDTLIDDLLQLSRVGRSEINNQDVDLSALAEAIARELSSSDPQRPVTFVIQRGLHAEGDERLLRIVLENLLRNAWKFTGRQPAPRIEFGRLNGPGSPFFVRDNGAGFDMAYVKRLFGVFQRLHSGVEFPGTGVGLATVQRIVNRHGGRVWAEGAMNQGASFYFSLPKNEDF